MTLSARRTRIELLDQHARRGLWREAARTGVLYSDSEFVRCGFGAARTISLPGGLKAPSAPHDVERALATIELSGDDGPGGSGVVAFGALPFDAAEAAALVVPELVCTWRPGVPGGWVTAVGDDSPDGMARLRDLAAAPSAHLEAARLVQLDHETDGAGYAALVARALTALRARGIAKVVLARRATGRCDRVIDAAWLADSLERQEPTCTIYAVALGAARFVGASPELIVATVAGAVSAHPLAGTVALHGDADDAARIDWLEHSSKNREEHAAVVDDIAARLAPLCDTVVAAPSPSIVALSTVAHLGTWIDAKLAEGAGAASSVRVLQALHPTPAVGGTPRDAALALITELEGHPRGAYAGAVGYVDAEGASSWTLGIRGVLVEAATLVAWAGAGIVPGSEPLDEAAETAAKLESVLRSLGG